MFRSPSWCSRLSRRHLSDSGHAATKPADDTAESVHRQRATANAPSRCGRRTALPRYVMPGATSGRCAGKRLPPQGPAPPGCAAAGVPAAGPDQYAAPRTTVPTISCPSTMGARNRGPEPPPAVRARTTDAPVGDVDEASSAASGSGTGASRRSRAGDPRRRSRWCAFGADGRRWGRCADRQTTAVVPPTYRTSPSMKLDAAERENASAPTSSDAAAHGPAGERGPPTR